MVDAATFAMMVCSAQHLWTFPTPGDSSTELSIIAAMGTTALSRTIPGICFVEQRPDVLYLTIRFVPTVERQTRDRIRGTIMVAFSTGRTASQTIFSTTEQMHERFISYRLTIRMPTTMAALAAVRGDDGIAAAAALSTAKKEEESSSSSSSSSPITSPAPAAPQVVSMALASMLLMKR
jgi:hypothetical protein